MSCTLKKLGISILTLAGLLGIVTVSCTTTAPFITSLTGLPSSITIPEIVVLTATGGPGSSSGLWYWMFNTTCGGTFTSTAMPNNGPANPITIGPTSITSVQAIYHSTGATPGPCTFTVKLITASGRMASFTATTTIVHTTPAFIYWSGGGKIWRCSVNILPCTPEEVVPANARGVAVDIPRGLLYWNGYWNGTKILRCSLETLPCTPEDVVTTPIEDNWYWLGLAVALDVSRNLIYWGDHARIWRCLVNSLPCPSNPERVVFSSTGYAGLGIALDESKGLLYWSNFTFSQIERCSLDILPCIPEVVSKGYLGKFGVAIDGAADMVYWVEGGTNGKIQRCSVRNLPCTPEDVVTHGVESWGLALDVSRGLVYWGENDKLRRCSVSSLPCVPEDVATGLSHSPFYIALGF